MGRVWPKGCKASLTLAREGQLGVMIDLPETPARPASLTRTREASCLRAAKPCSKSWMGHQLHQSFCAADQNFDHLELELLLSGHAPETTRRCMGPCPHRGAAQRLPLSLRLDRSRSLSSRADARHDGQHFPILIFLSRFLTLLKRDLETVPAMTNFR